MCRCLECSRGFGKGKTGITKNVELFGCLEYSRGGKPCLIAKENAVVLNH